MDHHLQPIMKARRNSDIKDKEDFLAKFTAALETPKRAILVTADVSGLYPSIPH